MKVIEVDQNGEVVKKKMKERIEDAKARVAQFWEKCKENKEAIIAVGSVTIPATVEVVKVAVRNRSRRDDNNRRKKSMWDPVEGHWWELKRPLTSSELLEVEHRVKNGESRGEVLYSMRVLK